MAEKKKLLVNCDLCDTRKMKEEDYSQFEQIAVNADIVLVNENSKSILNRLPVSFNTDRTMEFSMDVDVKTVKGSYRITGDTMAGEHTLLIVDGSLTIEPGTEEILKKYEQILVNGKLSYPKSLEGYIGKLTVNGSVTAYPDGCVVLDKEPFILDKYFPLRARENSRYLAKKDVIIKDESIDLGKLISKNVQFITKTLVLPESKIEECACIFDEKTEFIVVPEGMKLIADDVVLNEKLIQREGNQLFVYGDLEVDGKADMESISNSLEKLIVKGFVTIKEEQVEAFQKIEAEYEGIDIIDNRCEMRNLVRAKIDRALLENCEDGIRVCNAAMVVIDQEVEPALILEKLSLKNCAKVSCSKEQESAVSAVATNVAMIGEAAEGDETGIGSILGMIKSAADTKFVNADTYIM